MRFLAIVRCGLGSGALSLVSRLVLVACLFGSPPARAVGGGEPARPVSVRTEAEAHYRDGVEDYEAGRYAEAIEAFRSADRRLPSAAHSFNIARAYEKLGDTARALEFYREFLQRDPEAVHRDRVLARIAELERRLAAEDVQRLTVVSEPAGADLSIGGKRVGLTPWTGELEPGVHLLRLTKRGHRALEFSARLPREQSLLVARTLPGTPSVSGEGNPPSTAERHESSAWPWVTLGTGGAVLLSAGVFEILRRSAESDARDATSQVAYFDDLEQMKAHQTTSRVLFGIGAGLTLTGGIWLLLDRPSSADSGSSASASLGCGSASCYGAVGGWF